MAGCAIGLLAFRTLPQILESSLRGVRVKEAVRIRWVDGK